MSTYVEIDLETLLAFLYLCFIVQAILGVEDLHWTRVHYHHASSLRNCHRRVSADEPGIIQGHLKTTLHSTTSPHRVPRRTPPSLIPASPPSSPTLLAPHLANIENNKGLCYAAPIQSRPQTHPMQLRSRKQNLPLTMNNRGSSCRW